MNTTAFIALPFVTFVFSFLTSASVHSPSGTLSPPLGPQFLDVPYPSRPDKRLYLGKSSTLPSQENTTPGRYADMVSLPGGATPTHHQRWSNPGDSSPAWSTIQHTCRRPLTEYRAYSHEFSTLQSKEWKGSQQAAIIQDGSLKRDREPQLPPKVPRSATQVDLSEPNVSVFRFYHRNGYVLVDTASECTSRPGQNPPVLYLIPHQTDDFKVRGQWGRHDLMKASFVVFLSELCVEDCVHI